MCEVAGICGNDLKTMSVSGRVLLKAAQSSDRHAMMVAVTHSHCRYCFFYHSKNTNGNGKYISESDYLKADIFFFLNNCNSFAECIRDL